MTGLIDRAGTLVGAECETQKLPSGEIDWGDQPLRCNAGYFDNLYFCLLYTSPSPRDLSTSRMPSSA